MIASVKDCFFTNYVEKIRYLNTFDNRIFNNSSRVVFALVAIVPTIIFSFGKSLYEVSKGSYSHSKKITTLNVSEFAKKYKIVILGIGLSVVCYFFNSSRSLKNEISVNSLNKENKILSKRIFASYLKNIPNSRFQAEYKKMSNWMVDNLGYPAVKYLFNYDRFCQVLGFSYKVSKISLKTLFYALECIYDCLDYDEDLMNSMYSDAYVRLYN